MAYRKKFTFFLWSKYRIFLYSFTNVPFNHKHRIHSSISDALFTLPLPLEIDRIVVYLLQNSVAKTILTTTSKKMQIRNKIHIFMAWSGNNDLRFPLKLRTMTIEKSREWEWNKLQMSHRKKKEKLLCHLIAKKICKFDCDVTFKRTFCAKSIAISCGMFMSARS